MKLRANASVPNHPEYDYPFVEHDIPADEWVREIVSEDLVTDEAYYTGSLERLADRIRSKLDTLAPDDEAGYRRAEVLLRRLDDGKRRLVFKMLRQAWLRIEEDWPGLQLDKQFAFAVAEDALGPNERWIRSFRQYTYDSVRRLVVIPTWQCELRCSYCIIPKQDGRVMPSKTMDRSIDLLLSTDHEKVVLQFFGGEALLEWNLVQHAIREGYERATQLGKEIEFVVSSNGWSVNRERLDWLIQYPVRLELSLDGDAETMDKYRATAPHMTGSSYDNSIATHADDILASGIDQYVIMVVHNMNVDAMSKSFFHIADLGFKTIQVNFVLGRLWTDEQIKSFAKGLFDIGTELRRRWEGGDPLMCINLLRSPMPIRLNAEVTVDWDGTIYGGNGFLHETEHKEKFVIGHLDEHTNIDRYWIDLTDNNFLLQWSYEPHMTENNLEVGRVLSSWVKWMQKQGIGPGANEPFDWKQSTGAA